MTRDKMMIHGRVCCPCGGQIISNSGKVIGNTDGVLACWECRRKFDGDIVYSERIENQNIMLEEKTYYCYGPEGMNKCTETPKDAIQGLECMMLEGEPCETYEIKLVKMAEAEYVLLPKYEGP